MNVLIAGAWPYANGSLHIGHTAALLPGDILARYFRSKGNTVFFVSGSDCHGTPITLRSGKTGYRLHLERIHQQPQWRTTRSLWELCKSQPCFYSEVL